MESQGPQAYFKPRTATYNSQLAAQAAMEKEPSVIGIYDQSVGFDATVMAGPSIIYPPSTPSSPNQKSLASAPQGRRVFLIRNAERIDRIFPEWFSVAFRAGKYFPYDMNMPLHLYSRAGFPNTFCNDSPVTEMGAMTAQMIGRGLKGNQVPLSVVISSPALRCVQTAANILKAMESPLGVSVDALLCDFHGWYEQVPAWMTEEELKQAGLPVNGTYTPLEDRKAVHGHKFEPYIGFQCRVGKSVSALLKRCTGNVALVTHGTTIDAITRSLMGQRPTLMTDKYKNALGSMFPYCAVVVLEETGEGKWKVIDDAIPCITYVGYCSAANVPYGGQ